MLNMIKMDLYRMLRTRAMYIVWLFLFVAVIFSTYLLKDEYTVAEKQDYAVSAEEQTEKNIGMNVKIPTEPGEQVSLFDVVYANIQGKFVALFIVIFAVIFATADLNSGYIKNYGGQVKYRFMLVISKGVALAVYTAVTMMLFLVVQGLANLMYFGYFELGPAASLFTYMGTEVVLHWALALITMTLAIIIRNSVFGMILAISLCMNLMIIIYSAIDKLIVKTGAENFQLLNYTVTGKISALTMDLTAGNVGSALLVGAGFIIGVCALGCFVFQKRDI